MQKAFQRLVSGSNVRTTAEAPGRRLLTSTAQSAEAARQYGVGTVRKFVLPVQIPSAGARRGIATSGPPKLVAPAASIVSSADWGAPYLPKPQEEVCDHEQRMDQKFWYGKPAVDLEAIKIDMRQYDLTKILSARTPTGAPMADKDHPESKRLLEHMTEKWEKYGAIHLVETGLGSDMGAMQALVRLHFPVQPKLYEGGANLRGQVVENVYDTGAPGRAELAYHHEMAYIENSVRWLGFACSAAPKNPLRGATFLADNMGATKMLMDTPFGQKLKDKGLCYVRKLPDRKYFQDNNLDTSIVYNYWQTSFMTEDMDEAVAEANKQGLDVEWQDSPIFGRYMVTKYYASCFEYDPFNDRNVLYASLADDYFWFQSWPGLAELPHWERPLKLNFGDDSVMTREEKELFVDVYDRNGFPIMWEKGDVAMLCNWRYAHGRPSIELEAGESRNIGVVLGEPFQRVGELPDKW